MADIVGNDQRFHSSWYPARDSLYEGHPHDPFRGHHPLSSHQVNGGGSHRSHHHSHRKHSRVGQSAYRSALRHQRKEENAPNETVGVDSLQHPQLSSRGGRTYSHFEKSESPPVPLKDEVTASARRRGTESHLREVHVLHRDNNHPTSGPRHYPVRSSSKGATQLLQEAAVQIDQNLLLASLETALDKAVESLDQPTHPQNLDGTWNDGRHSGHRPSISGLGLTVIKDDGPETKALTTNIVEKSHQHHQDSKCECPSVAVICHCSSSEEFRKFSTGTISHKQNPSVSSTTCFVSVPTSRFRTVNWDSKEEGEQPQDATNSKTSGDVSSTSSAPSLSDGSTVSNTSDETITGVCPHESWPLPVVEDYTKEVQGHQDYVRKMSTASLLDSDQPQPASSSRTASFSRPFKPEQSGSPTEYLAAPRGARPSLWDPRGSGMLPRRQSSINWERLRSYHLGSISTMSTMSLDFDAKDEETEKTHQQLISSSNEVKRARGASLIHRRPHGSVSSKTSGHSRESSLFEILEEPSADVSTAVAQPVVAVSKGQEQQHEDHEEQPQQEDLHDVDDEDVPISPRALRLDSLASPKRARARLIDL